MSDIPMTLKYKDLVFRLGGVDAESTGEKILLTYSAASYSLIPPFRYEACSSYFDREDMEAKLEVFMNDFTLGFFKVVVAPVEAMKG